MILNRELEEDSVLNFGSLDVELEKCIFGTLQISGMQWEQEVNKKQKRQEGYCDISTMPFLCLLGWDGIYFGYGVTTALKIVQRSTPFLTRHFASRLGGFTPMNNLPHSRSWSDPYYEKTFMKRAQELPESPRITLCQQDPGVWKKGR